MPHIIVDYAYGAVAEPRLDALMACVEAAATSTGTIALQNLKLRLHECRHVRVQGTPQAFVHVSVALMAGPTEAARISVSRAILAALTDFLPDISNITVDIREMNRATYSKRISA